MKSFSKDILIDGQFESTEKVLFPISSTALQHGFGVYETIKIESRRAFHLDDHIARLFHSAALIDLTLAVNKQALIEWCEKMIGKSEHSDFVLRLLALGGETAEESAKICLIPQPLPKYPERYYLAGATAITYHGFRSIPQCKSIGSLVNFLARRETIRRSVHEAILTDGDEVTEGSRSNIFIVKNEEIITPPPDRVLSGITREIVIRLAKEKGLPFKEEPIALPSVLGADEFFITSTSMHVMPINALDQQSIGDGRVGPVTRKLMLLFVDYYRARQGF